MPVLIRLLGNSGIPPMSQVFLRYIFAFIAAAIFFLSTGKAKIKIQSKDIVLLVCATVFGYALVNLFFTYGILNTQVSNALFLFYSYAIIAPILGFIFLKEKIKPANIIALGLSLLALLFLFQPNALPTWKIGGFFAILSAIGQASYLVLRKKLHNYTARFMMLANTFVGVIVVGALSLLFEKSFYVQGIFHLSINAWIVTVLFGFLNFFAWFTMTKGFEYFKATAGSVILLSELIFGIIFAMIFFAEFPTYLTILGGALIIASSVLVIYKGEN